MEHNQFFIEIDVRQLCELGSATPGDVCLTKRGTDRSVMVMSDGSGSGIKANVIASVIASMAMNYSLNGEHPMRAAKAIIETFARGEQIDNVNQATFTIITILDSGKVQIAEFENPAIVVVRDGKWLGINREEQTIVLSSGIKIRITISEFQAVVEDRIVLFTDGIPQSGTGTRRMPKGWGENGVATMICDTINQSPTISATDLATAVVARSEANDLFMVKNDMACAAIYFREPRKILVCSGPPYDSKKDAFLAETVRDYEGATIISGGTTAHIVSRELGREISVIMRKDTLGLPPASTMEGVSMVTEGVLTLAKVKAIINNLKSSDIKGNGIAEQYVRMLLEHDQIEFLVGSCVNSAHQDPRLPIELELRRNVIKEIARILESKFMKNTTIKYI